MRQKLYLYHDPFPVQLGLTGHTGELLSLAVIKCVDGSLHNIGTTLIGDRQILIDLIQAVQERGLSEWEYLSEPAPCLPKSVSYR